MANLLLMPEIAANAVDALLANWLVAEGAPFGKGETLAVIETEKAAVDLDAESDGVLLRMLVANGATVDVGAPIALVGEPGERVGDIEAELARLGVAKADPVVAASASPAAAAAAPVTHVNKQRVFSSPLARRLARDGNVALALLVGTGPGGRIVRRDVVAAMAGGPIRPSGPTATPVPATGAAKESAAGGGVTDIPHTRMRRAIASRLTQSKQTAPHFYVRGTCRVDALLAARATMHAHTGQKASINDWIVKAIATAHTLVPEMNVIWTDDAIRQFTDVDVSVAIATDTGLLTPVLRSADRRGVNDLAESVQDLAIRARAGQVQPQELEGGSITVTNLGMFGVEEFSAIINPPQSAILAVGAVTREAVVDGDTVGVASVLRVVLSVDHRPVDGVTAARWMKQFVTLVENPILIFS